MAKREVLHFLLVLLMVTSGHAGNSTAKITAIFNTFGKHLIPGLLIAWEIGFTLMALSF
jgi:hypothetical protein